MLGAYVIQDAYHMSFKKKLRFCHFRQKKRDQGPLSVARSLIMIKYKYTVEALVSSQPQEGKLELATYKM